LAEGIAHDYGHFARLGELGVHTRQRTITQWPWPFPLALSVENFGGDPFALPPRSQPGVFAGGEQAASALKTSLTDEIYRRDAVDAFDWLMFAYATLDSPVYGLTDLARPHFTSPAQVFAEGPGDFRDYAVTMARLSPSSESFSTIRQNADHLRRDVWLNFADVTLASAIVRTAQYVWTGEHRAAAPLLRIGRWGWAPAAHSTLTSLGPETGFDLRVVSKLYVVHFDAGRITTASDRGLWMSSIDLLARGSTTFRPEGRLAAWQQPGGGSGVRIEVGGRRTLELWSDRLSVAVRIGYKSAGYQIDAPERAGLLFSLSSTVRVR